jgi:tetratricopeptide (TPR) repeat protein
VEQAHRKLAEYRSPVTGDAIPAELLGVDVRQLQRWESGETTPRPLSIWLMSRTYGLRPEDLDLPPLDDLDAELEHGTAPDAAAGKITDVERREFVKRMGAFALSSDQLARIVTLISHESRTHIARAELSNVGPAMLEQLTADVARLSRAFVSQPMLTVFAELVDTRDRIYTLLDGHQSPSQTAELYFLAGQTCGLLANASLDLGQHAAAAEHARSAWAYGDMIGHGALGAFGRATQSLIAYWSGAYDEAVTYAQAGLPLSEASNVRARLLALEARAQAKLGRVQAVVGLVDAASEAIEGADRWTAPGGHLEFTRAKLHYYATNAYVDVRRYADAITYGERSIQLYQATPTDVRSYGDEAGCYVALADVSVRQGAIDGASARLAPVLAHPHTSQIQPLRAMLGGLRRQLVSTAARGKDSRALIERLESF